MPPSSANLVRKELIKPMVRKMLSYGLAVLLVIAFQPPFIAQAAAPSYSLEISNDKPSKGDQIEVAVKGKYLTDVYGYEINVDYDASRLNYVEMKTDIKGFPVQQVDEAGGHIQFAHTKTGEVPGDNGDLTLVTLTFKAKEAGKASLEFKKVKLVDSHMTSKVDTAGVKSVVEISEKAGGGGNPGTKFTDVPLKFWAYNAIMELAAKQIVNGTSPTTFEPNRPITRAEFATLLVNALKLKVEGHIKFVDVPAKAWYAKPIAIAYQAGIVKGKSPTTFDPTGKITREEMVTMLMQAYEVKNGKKLSVYSGSPFNDMNKVSTWAANYVKAAAELKLINGRLPGQFVPKGVTNRAESAQVIYNLVLK